MSHSRRSNLDAFIEAAHRRLVLLRTIERAGLCAAISCPFAAVLMAVLIWRGQPAMDVALALIGLGLLGGAAWGLVNRPSQLQAAIEADRQLGLDDLLATAWNALRRNQDDAWARSVIAIAEARCATLSPRSLVLRRYGARAWSGIGLATAVVLGIGALSSQPLVLRAGEPDENPLSAGRPAQRDRMPDASPTSTMERSTPRADRSRREATSAERSVPGFERADDESPAATATDEPSAASGSSSGESGRGRGESRSATPPQTPPSPRVGTVDRSGENSSVGRSGAAGPGADDGDAAAAGAAAASPDRSAHPAPWDAPSWSRDRDGALQAIDRGAVPDAYRDLVREYFDARTPRSR